MIFGYFLILVIVISIINNFRKKGVSGDTKGKRYGGWTSLFIFLGLFSLLVVAVVKSEHLLFYRASLVFLLFSGYLIPLFIFFGWVRIAYYWGRINIFNLTRNPKGMDLYRAYRAALRKKNKEKAQAALRWVHTQCHKQKGDIFSGQMTMYVIIDAQLTHPGDYEYLAKRLRLLKYLATESIPKQISTYACKLALAPELARGHWPSIIEVCQQWNTPAKNYLSLYLIEFHGCYISNNPYTSRFTCWRYSLLIMRFRKLIHFAKTQARMPPSPPAKNSADAAKPKQQLLATAPLEEAAKQSIREQLTGKEQQSLWEKRAAELGVHQPENSWANILSSIDECKQLKAHSASLDTQQDYDRFEEYHKKLHYIRGSIQQKLDKNMQGPGLPHFLDWLQVLQILEAMQSNKPNQHQAFDSIHVTLWDWVADLWNVRKDRCLAHQIAFACHTLAVETGNEDFARVLSGIYSAEYQ